MKKLLAIACLLLATTGFRVMADTEVEGEQRLNQEAAEINKTPSTPAKDSARVAELSKRFNVSESTVASMRSDKKMGWGEVTIALAISQEMSVRSQKTDKPLTIDQSLSEVMRLRTQEKMGWGRIAKENGFKLGPVVRATKHGREAIRTADRRTEERLERKAEMRHERLEKVQKHERHEKLEHPIRPENPRKR